MDWKVGDKVVRINEDGNAFYKIGDIATVMAVYATNVTVTNEAIKQGSSTGTFEAWVNNLRKLTKLERALQ